MLILVSLVIAKPASCFAQGEGSNWYFGNSAGITFTTNPPTAVGGALITGEGCSTISDAQGNLLFYTDGSTIWTRTHTVMANGTGLLGHTSTAQSGIIVKQPGVANIYYVFTMGVSNIGNLNYSIVDMSLAAGHGSVITKNVLVHGPCLEKLTGVKHSNNIDIWILVHESSAPATNFNWRAYLLTATGLNTTPVISTIGLPANSHGLSYARFSPDGTKLASGCYGMTAAELFDFNRSTGVLTNSITLPAVNGCYGVEFSPNGSILYGGSPGQINQWDLCAGSAAAIAASRQIIPATSNWGMQLAPDGKIYVARYQQTTLGVINNPNVAGPGCNYVDQGFPLTTGASGLGLSNYITSWFMPPAPQFTVVVGTGTNGLGCMSAAFLAPANSSVFPGCSAMTSSIGSVLWNFGDPLSGTANTSTLNSVQHNFSALGSYTVQLVVYYTNNAGTDTLRQVVNINQPCVTVSSNSITCASLGTATVQAVGGLGPFTYTWMPTAQSGSIATGLAPGAYTITVNDAGANSTYTAQVVFTSLVPLTGNLSNASSVTCHGASNATATVLNIAGGSGKQWYLWSNGQTSYTTAFTNSLSAGVWSVTVTDSLTSCQINNSFLVLQPPAQSLSLTASSPSVCLGGSISFTGQAQGGTPGYSYSWSAGPSADSHTVTETTAGVHIYTLTAFDSNTCPVSQTITADFVAPPVLTVTGATICPLETGTLTVSGAPNYTWSTSSNNSSITGSPAATTVYSVIGEASLCTSSATASIVLKTVPAPLVASNSPRCEQTQLQLFSGGGSSFLWSGPQSFTSNSQQPLINNVTLNQAGVYVVTVTAANSCTASASTTVIVNQTPTLSATGSTVCVNGTMQLFANATAGSAFSWTGPSNFSSPQQNPTLGNPPLSNSGNYTVQVSLQGCTASAVAHVSVVPLPVVSFTTNSPRCEGESLTLNASATKGGTVFSWSGPNGFAGNNITEVIGNVNTLAGGLYQLNVSNGPCIAQASVMVIVHAMPTPTITYNGPVCEGNSMTVNIVAPATQNIVSYSITGPLMNSSLPSNVVNPVNSLHAGVYSATVTDINGCSGVHSESIVVRPNPTVTALGTTVCLNYPATLTAQGADSYYWVGPSLLNNHGEHGVVSAAMSDQPVTYYVTGTAANGCTATTQAELHTWELPVPSIKVSPSAQICLNDALTLTGSGGVYYEWLLPPGHAGVGQTFTFVADRESYHGTYTLVVTDARWCRNSAVKTVTVHGLPSGGITSNAMEGCVPFCAEFSYSPAVMSTKATSMNWQIDGRNYPSKTFSHCFTKAKTYIIKGSFTDSLTGCENADTYTVQAWAQPVASFSWYPEKPVEKFDEVVFYSRSKSLNATPADSENGLSNTWYLFDEADPVASEQMTKTFDEAGIYMMALVVEDHRGCADTVVKPIEILPDFHVYIPNAFTPNGDGLNDVFAPVMRGAQRFVLRIFNRWGELIYQSEDQLKGWDGNYRGEPSPQGVYTWLLNIASLSGESKTVNGEVTLYR